MAKVEVEITGRRVEVNLPEYLAFLLHSLQSNLLLICLKENPQFGTMVIM
jgi:hypothetical protein